MEYMIVGRSCSNPPISHSPTPHPPPASTHPPLLYPTLDTPEPIRQQYLGEFNRGKVRVLLVSITAGGVGLDLTAASLVLFVQVGGCARAGG